MTPLTPAGEALDVAWPGTHIDRLEWRGAIAAIERQAADRALAELRREVEEAGLVELLEWADDQATRTTNSWLADLVARVQEGLR